MSTQTLRTQLPVIPSTVPTHDNTMFRDWVRCPRLYAVHHVKGWRKRGGKEAPLAFGTLVHLGLETYYSARISGKDVAASLFEAMQKMKEAKYEDPPEDFRTKARAIADVQKYVIYYKGDHELDLFLSEVAFDIEDDDGYRYGGRLDLVARYSGRVFPWDHKTTTRFGPYYYDNYKMDPQMYGYFWAGGKLSGQDMAGVYINTIILHKGETKFDRKPVLFSKTHIERWKNRNIRFYLQIDDRRRMDPEGIQWHNVDIWTPNFENCVDRYGQCPMYKVCHAPTTNQELHLNMNFEPGKWDFANVED